MFIQVDDKKTRKLVYAEHLHLTKIQAGLKSGKYLQVYIMAELCDNNIMYM